MMRTAVLLVAVLALNSCCKMAPNGAEKQVVLIENIAREKLGEPLRFISSPGALYKIALNQKKSNPNQPYSPLKFVVFNTQNASIVFEENLRNGKLEWVDETHFKVTTVPGIVPEETEAMQHGYLYDCKTGEKRSLTP